MLNKIYKSIIFSSIFIFLILVFQIKVLLTPLMTIKLSVVENIFLILIFLFIIVINLFIFRRDKISKLLYFTSLPLVLLSFYYIVLLVANIPNLFIKLEHEKAIIKVTKDEYNKFKAINSTYDKLKNELIRNKNLRTSELKKFEPVSNELYNDLLDIHDKYIIIGNYIMQNEFSHKETIGKKEEVTTILNFYNFQLIEIYLINDYFDKNNKEEALKIIKLNYNILLKFMQMKKVNDFDAELLNNILGKYIYYISMNISKLNTNDLEFINFENLEKTHKEMLNKAYLYKDSDQDRAIKNSLDKISIFSYPLINKDLSKMYLNNKSKWIVNNYGIEHSKRIDKSKKIEMKNYFINPFWNLFIAKLFKVNTSLKDYDNVYNKIKLFNYIIKSNGNYEEDKLPINIITGKKFILVNNEKEKFISSGNEKNRVLIIK